MVVVDRADAIDRPVPDEYEGFIEAPERLLIPRSSAPAYWDHSSEYPLVARSLRNGIKTRIGLSPLLEGLSATVLINFGAHDHPGTHTLEHLMRHSRVIPDLDKILDRSIVDCSGFTGPNELSYRLELGKAEIALLSQRNPDFKFDMLYLLYTMMAQTSITDNGLERDRGRLIDESYGRQDNAYLRLYDRVVPAVVAGRTYAVPSIETELGHTTDDLRTLHRTLPFQTVEISILGDPGGGSLSSSRDEVAKAAYELHQFANRTFGLLPERHPPATNGKVPRYFDQFGPRVSVKPGGFNFKSDYVDIATVTKQEGNPAEIYRQRLFTYFLNHAFKKQMYEAGLLYSRHFAAIDFQNMGMRINFTGLRTSQPDKVIALSENLLQGILDGDRQLPLGEYFQAVKAIHIGESFQRLTTNRLYLSEYVGLPTGDNCSALYELMQETKLEDVLETAGKISDRKRIGLIHYGPTKIDQRRDFEMVREDQLVI